MPTPKLNFLQVEYIRDGTNDYRPRQPGFIDLTSAVTANTCSGGSDHATQVAALWQGNNTLPLVAYWYVCEALNFTLKSSLWGQAPGLIAPKPAQWHLAILPFGFTCNWTAGALTQFALQCERDNVLALVSPADAGQNTYQFPSNVSSANILKVASSTTGSNIIPQSTPDVYYPVDWNSYVEPSLIRDIFASLIDWLLQNGIPYQASILRAFSISTAINDSQGRPILQPAALIAAVKAHFGAPPVPAPTPVTPPVVVAPPAPPVVVPPPPPIPVPSVDDLRATAAKGAGSSYDPLLKLYSVPVGQVPALAAALASAGLQ